MTGNDVVNILIPQLLSMGFTVHRYNAKSTSSIYLKLDYGVACGIRIADHPGREKYHYRFNVLKDYEGDRAILRDSLISYFFNYNELDKLLEAVKQERHEKICNYGIDNYKKYMDKSSKDRLYGRFEKVGGE